MGLLGNGIKIEFHTDISTWKDEILKYTDSFRVISERNCRKSKKKTKHLNVSDRII